MAKPTPITYQDEYPLLSALAELGFQAILRNGRVAIAPADKITPTLAAKVRQFHDELSAEIQKRNIAEAIAKAGEFDILPNPNRYSSCSEAELLLACEEWEVCYALAAELYNAGNKDPVWNGAGSEPPLPYYWVQDVILPSPDGETHSTLFWCMFRDESGKDFFTPALEIRAAIKKRQERQGF